jgi:acetyl-CoA synthetase
MASASLYNRRMEGTGITFGGEIAWRPSAEVIAGSRLQQFIDRYGLRSYEDLLARSTTDVRWFWNAVIDDLDIEFYAPYSDVLDLSAGIARPRWCVGGELNIVHNCLDKRIGTPTEHKTVVRWEGEDGTTLALTYGELTRSVNRCANGLRALGIGRGDRIALFLPMCPELIVAFFATIKIGAIALPLFSGYGADAVVDRVSDSGACVLITADGFLRRGQQVHMKAVAEEAVERSAGVRHVVMVPRGPSGSSRKPQAHAREGGSRKEIDWATLMLHSDKCETERTQADDPFMIIYTSGTTGRPKGAVHTHCGFPIKAAQDMAHGFDVRGEDTMFWVTDMGWMMGPWEVLGVALLGGTFVIYDGAVDHPDPGRLWSIVERHRVSILGVSPTLIRTLMKHGDTPVRAHDLSTLRILGSTGEPWNQEPWRWFFDAVGGGRLPIINYSGGTEVSGGLLVGNVLTPMKPCAFAGPPPGIAADVVNDRGEPVRNTVGELVVRQPWIGMTRGFWNDPDRYMQTYWSRFPDVWVHGDWAAIDEDGLWYILGRSDDTIKVAGKRLGPAEVESVLVEHPAVVEAAAIGVPDETKGQALVCFCVLNADNIPGPVLVDDLRNLVADRLGKPLRPKTIEFVKELPKTRNAKVMRRVLRAAYLGEPIGDLSALENPRAADEIATIRQRK